IYIIEIFQYLCHLYLKGKKMIKFQAATLYFNGVFTVICVIFSMLFAFGEFKGFETSFIAGFLFLISYPFLFQMNKLTIPNNFKHNKTLRT
ncbi:MAG: hypothetical protein Q7U59_13785, partial [Lutibacter sp.]|nr:hypothetical protein [Lutibacter sp.]